jgi:hypothetical protein
MMMDSRLIWSSLHAIAKFGIADRQREKCDRKYYPKQVLHKNSSLKSFSVRAILLSGGDDAASLALCFDSAIV